MRRISPLLALLVVVGWQSAHAQDGTPGTSRASDAPAASAPSRLAPSKIAPPKIAPPKIAWYGTLKSGLAEAKRSQRPILFVSGAPQCLGVPGIW